MKISPRQLRKRFGATVRELRMRNGWTQKELATRLQQSGFERCERSLISQIESGSAYIHGEEIFYLRKVFGKPFERDFWNPYYNRNAIRDSARKGAA